MELYKKVYIKSEADLPKEDGNYIVQFQDKSLQLFLYKVKESHWFTNIDWYLQPISELTDEEIEKWACDSCNFVEGLHDAYRNVSVYARIAGAKAMRDGKIQPIGK